jgi:HTH-type transcriptional dual regulator CecR, C-terminal domain
MADPTPALDRVVEAGIRPRIEYARELVAELLGCPAGDERVWRLVAGIHAECLFHMPTPVSRRIRPGARLTPRTVDELADHIADVTLAGARVLAGRAPANRRSRRAGAGAA